MMAVPFTTEFGDLRVNPHALTNNKPDIDGIGVMSAPRDLRDLRVLGGSINEASRPRGLESRHPIVAAFGSAYFTTEVTEVTESWRASGHC